MSVQPRNSHVDGFPRLIFDKCTVCFATIYEIRNYCCHADKNLKKDNLLVPCPCPWRTWTIATYVHIYIFIYLFILL